MRAPRFTVAVATVRATTLEAALASALTQRLPPYEVVVVGQGDREPLEEAVGRAVGADPRVRYVHLDVAGLSRARNAAVRAARGDAVAFLDDDCEADPGWLEALAAGFALRDDVGVVGGAVVAPPPVRRPSSCPAIAPAHALYDPIAAARRPPEGWDWIGANFAIRTGVARRVGPWDELLGAGADFPAAEDTDYKLRLEAAGVVMVSTPAAVVHHTSGRRYGVRAVLRSQVAYATGNGALAGKQTLSGDPRGEIWLRQARHECWEEARRVRVLGLVKAVRRLWYFSRSYRRCVRLCDVDAAGLLRWHAAGDRVAATASRADG